MRKRTQDEYLFAFAFALIIALFMAVVIWNTATASGESSHALRLDPVGKMAVDSTKTPPGIRFEGLRELALKLPEGDITPGNPVSPAELAGETPGPVREQTQQPPLEQTTQASTPASEIPWNYSIPAPWSAGHLSGGAVPFAAGGSFGGYFPTGSARRATEQTDQASVAGEAQHAVAQSTSRQHLTVDDSAPAESIPAAPVAATQSSGPSISTLSAPLAATLDGIVPPAAVLEDPSWPALQLSSAAFEDAGAIPREALASPDPIAQLVAAYGDPLVVLARPDLGAEPPLLTATPAEEPRINPEPATLLLLGTGLGLLAQRLRRRGQSDPGFA